MKKNNIKVAIFHCGFLYSGGGERIVLEEAKGLIEKGYEVSIFAPALDKRLCFPDEIKRLNVNTFLPQLPSFIPARNALWMVLSSFIAPILAFNFRDKDIFFGANQPGVWIAYCMAKVLRKPYLIYINQPNRLLYHRKVDEEVNWQNLKEYYFIDNLIKKLRVFIAWADKISFTSGTAMLADGDYIGKIIENIYKKNVIMCPAGAYPQKYRNLLFGKNKHGGIFEIDNMKGERFSIKKPYILLTNRHVPQKKFEYAIKSLKIIVNKYPNALLVIPSSFTGYTKELKTLAKKLEIYKSVIFTDQINEETLQFLYQNATVYVYTSPEEDFGMGVIESMGWGVPVVAWNYAGPTVTVDNGKTGYLAKPYDVNDFADKILKILNNLKLRDKMGKAAWQRVKDKFSWDIHVGIIDREIKKALRNKNKHV